ncbi:hypothetical protein AB0I28_23245 [Phytomonospora sp. NPDC050363]|uniref:hypothetical protein n=1 Tax=Phytomonospora sp. NPDC050363 TaxID=3155642 RepID=UPI0033F928E1
MNRTDIRRGLLLLAATAAATGLAALSGTGAYAAGPLNWTQTKTPDPGNWYAFEDLEVLAADDVWSAGSGPDMPMIAHWDGADWTQHDLPGGVLSVQDLAVAGGDDVWGVGAGGTTWYEGRVVHYDGEKWSVVEVPYPEVGSAGQITMNNVVTTGDDVWATGIANRSIDGERVRSGFTLHFDGAEWTLAEIPIPDKATDVDYVGLDVLANGDIVASGVQFVPIPEDPAFSRAMPWVTEFDGAQWTDIGYADFGEISKHGAIADTAVDKKGKGIWFTGTLWQEDPETGAKTPEPYLVHYNGKTGEWSRPKLPTAVGVADGALAVDKRGGVVLAVSNGSGGGEGGGYLLHYDGETVERWEQPQHEGSWSYTQAAYVPGTNVLWLAGCTREESGRPITGVAAYGKVSLRH